jgi:type IV secretion system protein TrbI
LRPYRRQAAEAETAAAAGPPETIGLAPESYGAADPDTGDSEALDDMSADHALAPPASEVWAGLRAAASAQACASAPDPELVARTAPVLFASPAQSRAAPGDAVFDGGRHSAFLARQRAGGEDRLAGRLTPPRSRYELLAGAVIPAALHTELNSDLPGRVIAQVTAPVFDSVTGHLDLFNSPH